MKNCIIFITTPKELENLELDDNFMPKLNEYNSNILNCTRTCTPDVFLKDFYFFVVKRKSGRNKTPTTHKFILDI